MKKIISVILAVLMLAVLAVPAFADDAIAIKTAEEFMAMESGKSYYLANDIDFGGKVFDTFIVPGTGFVVDLDGKGFTLKNFSFKAEAPTADIAMFQQFAAGTIKNLNIGSADAPIAYKLVDAKDSSSYAMLVASTKGDETPRIENVHIYTDMELTYTNLGTRLNLGGFIAYARKYEIVKSSMNGKIVVKNDGGETTKWRNVGGFIGSDKDSNSIGTIEDSVNNADITLLNSSVEGRVAGFVAYSDKKANVIKNCTNNGTITLGTSAGNGHIAGIIACAKVVETAVVEGCTNNGKIVFDCTNAEDAKAGTLAAGILGYAQRGDITVKNCTSTVEVKTGAAANNEIVALVADGNTVNAEGNKTSADAPVVTEPVVTEPVVTEPETKPEETKPEETKPAETEPSSPSTGDHSVIIVALAAVMSLAGAACAVIARRGKDM